MGALFRKRVIAVAIAAALLALGSTAYGALSFYRGHGVDDTSVKVTFELRGPEKHNTIILRDSKVEDFAMNNFEWNCPMDFHYRDSGDYKGSIDVQNDGDFTGSSELSNKPNIDVTVKGQFSHEEAKANGLFKLHYSLPNAGKCVTGPVYWKAHAD